MPVKTALFCFYFPTSISLTSKPRVFSENAKIDCRYCSYTLLTLSSASRDWANFGANASDVAYIQAVFSRKYFGATLMKLFCYLVISSRSFLIFCTSFSQASTSLRRDSCSWGLTIFAAIDFGSSLLVNRISEGAMKLKSLTNFLVKTATCASLRFCVNYVLYLFNTSAIACGLLIEIEMI